MRQSVHIIFLLILMALGEMTLSAQTSQYTMPEETAEHEGTWLQWPHNHLYGPWYKDDVTSTFVDMTQALQAGENVHIIAYDSTELTDIVATLSNANIPQSNIDFFVHRTDDVWSRDNGPIFVYDQNNELTILDWGFNGWGLDTPYSNCDVIPLHVSNDIDIPRIDLSAIVLEGGAIEHDGKGTMFATRSSVTHSSRNPSLTETEIENYLTTYLGITKFIWLDGVYGQEITDMHIDGYVKFANDSTLVTMNYTDLEYWLVTPAEIDIIYTASNINEIPYIQVTLPLTQNNVRTTYGTSLGYKGSYVNYYIANDVVLVPTYNDPNDATALNIIQGLYPNRTAVGIDVRNIYEYGGMIHCLTQQQPVTLSATGSRDTLNERPKRFELGQNYPNPFNPGTVIKFRLPERSKALLNVYTLLGEQVATLVNEFKDMGNHEIQLEAENLPSGIFIYTLNINGQVVARKKMLLIK